MAETEQTRAEQVAIVTGGGRGIGRALAIALVDLGLTVLAVDGDFPEATPAGVTEMRADLANPYSVERLAREVIAEYGAPHLLVNGAVVTPVASLLELPPEEWDRALAVNLRGPFLMCRAFLPGMLERAAGTIVNLVSAEALPFVSAYAASMHGLAGFTRSLAAEVGEPGLQVVAFDAGMVDTPGLREAGSALAPRLGLTLTQFMAKAIPAEHAAEAAVLLITRFARQYHGQVVSRSAILEQVSGQSSLPEAGEKALDATSALELRTRAELLREAQRATARLQAILDQTVTELSRLPVVLRPLAQRRFRARTGQPPEHWSRVLIDLQGHLRQSDRVIISGRDQGRPGHPGLMEGLQELRAYFAAAPDELGRFSRDAETRRYLVEQSRERTALIDSLVNLLEQLGG